MQEVQLQPRTRRTGLHTVMERPPGIVKKFHHPKITTSCYAALFYIFIFKLIYYIYFSIMSVLKHQFFG